MGPDGSSLEDEPRACSPASGESDPGLVLREPYLRRVLAEFEAGRLEPYEYTRRVLAINAATSTREMEAIADQPPDVAADAVAPSPTRGFDAVDLARMRSQQLPGPRTPTTRYVTLAVVFVLFAVLIGIGMWLATHVHAVRCAGALHAGAHGRPRLSRCRCSVGSRGAVALPSRRPERSEVRPLSRSW